ncbi:hypothetical protein M0Q97_08510 [Candidatus Dojkabacteria bacterium]|jgi:hypothetical protein|nr:hypothetical protein [Candidatus Dojkabacteria bacterium]
MKQKSLLNSTLNWFGYEKNTVGEKVILIDGEIDGTLTWYDNNLEQYFRGKYGDILNDTINTYVIDDYVQNYFL